MFVSAISVREIPPDVIEQIEGSAHHKKPQLTFEGYNFTLKKLYRKGLLPKDLVDLGGNKITQKNLSGDHGIPKSLGGRNTDDNMILCTKQFNSMRGNRPLREVVTMDNLIKWIDQFIGLKIGKFDGDKHIKDILRILGLGGKK